METIAAGLPSIAAAVVADAPETAALPFGAFFPLAAWAGAGLAAAGLAPGNAAFDAIPDAGASDASALDAGASDFDGMTLDARDLRARALDSADFDDVGFDAGAVPAVFGAFTTAGAFDAFAVGFPDAAFDAADFGLAAVTSFPLTDLLAALDDLPAGAAFTAGFSVLDFAILRLPVRGGRAAPRSCGATRRRTGFRLPSWCEAV